MGSSIRYTTGKAGWGALTKKKKRKRKSWTRWGSWASSLSIVLDVDIEIRSELNEGQRNPDRKSYGDRSR